MLIRPYLAVLLARLTAPVAAKHIAAIVFIVAGGRPAVDRVAQRNRAAIGEKVLHL